MDYKTLSSLLGHYSVAFTMDTYVHCMDERKRSEMDKMDDLYDMEFEMPMGDTAYPVICLPGAESCQVYLPDFPNIQISAVNMEAALRQAKQAMQKALRQFRHPPIPTKQEKIVLPANAFLLLLRTA